MKKGSKQLRPMQGNYHKTHYSIHAFVPCKTTSGHYISRYNTRMKKATHKSIWYCSFKTFIETDFSISTFGSHDHKKYFSDKNSEHHENMLI